MMTVRWLGVILAIAGVSLLTSCSAQSGSAPQTAAGSTATAGCEIDARKVCQQLKENLVVDDASTGQLLGIRELQERGQRTVNVFRPYQIPGGSAFEVNCQINTEHDSVIYAHTTRRPALSDSDIQFLRSHDLCEQ